MRLIQEKTIVGLGVVLAVLPFTGFPRSWKTAVSAAIGIVLVYVGALLLKAARTRIRMEQPEMKTETFTEIRVEAAE